MDGVVAAVLTHRRPRLATATVNWLVDQEGFEPSDVIVVVNGDGGVAPAAGREGMRIDRLPRNLGPAGGFNRIMQLAFAEPDVQWVYLCEDDVCLLDLPAGRVRHVLAAVAEWEATSATRVGAVVAYGRRFTGRRGTTRPYEPLPEPPLQPVDVAAWGATFVSRRVFDAGVEADEALFFGYEDFDFYLRIRQAGLEVLVDAAAGRAVAGQMTLSGRDAALRDYRPVDSAEPWRGFYVARNYIAFAHRHGDWRWTAWHLALSLRRAQLSHDARARRAIAHGLVSGIRGRLGSDPRYQRTLGERGEQMDRTA